MVPGGLVTALFGRWPAGGRVVLRNRHPRPDESADQYVARGYLLWRFLLVILVILAWVALYVVYIMERA